jgi:hypothetical protein
MFLIWGLIIFFTILIIYQILLGCNKIYIIEGMETTDTSTSTSTQCSSVSCDLPTICTTSNLNSAAIDEIKKKLDKMDQTSLQNQIDSLKKEVDELNAQAQANAQGQATLANNFASSNSTPVTGADSYAPGYSPPQ